MKKQPYYSKFANGSLTFVDKSNDPNLTYAYDYRNRMELASVYGGTAVSYEYNPSGIRVKSVQGAVTTKYLIDPYNPTGYAQTLKTDDNSNKVFYALGHDIISQATDTSNPSYYLYDGHGSVRHLVDSTGALISGQSFNYDAYECPHLQRRARIRQAKLHEFIYHSCPGTHHLIGTAPV